MKNHQRQRPMIVLATLGLAVPTLTGCPEPASPSIIFVRPSDGATFLPGDDVSEAISGVQIDVVVRATGLREGARIELRVNGESVATFTYAGSDLTFSDVTIQPGDNTLRASSGSASAQITVRLEEGLRCPRLQFVRPTANARLDAAADDDRNPANGFQYRVELSTDAPDGTLVQLSVSDAAAATATATGGRVVFDGVTLLAVPPAPGTEHQVRLAAQTASDCRATITVLVVGPDIPCPEFRFVDPEDGAALGLADDENRDPTDGFQKTVQISTNAPTGTEVEFLVDGGVVARTTVVSSLIRFPDVDLSDGERVLRIQLVEEQECGAEIRVTVETGAPSCDIIEPVGGYLNAADDTDATTPGLQIVFRVASDGGSGQPVHLVINGNETGAPTANISGGHAVFPNIHLPEGTHTVRARCRNAVGNVGWSPTFTYTVDTIVPSCVITRPPDGAWFTEGDDALATVPGTQVEVGVRITDAPTATTVAQCGYAPLEPEGRVTPDATGVGSGYATLTGRGNQICCEVQDAAGNVGTARITLNLDTEVPQLEIRRPGPLTELILAADDEGPADTLCQYTVQVGCSNIDQPVTLSINGFDHARTETCAADASEPLGGTAAWTAITLPQGPVTLQARGRSIGGLLGTSPEKTVTVDTMPPALTVTFPRCGTSLTPADDNDPAAPGIQYRVSVLSDTSPVTLEVTDANGAAIEGSPYTRTIVPPAAAVFASVTLVPSSASHGIAYLRARAVDAYGQEGFSLPNPCSIEVRDVPRVTITSPSPNAVLGPANDCDPGRPGFDLGVTVSTNITSGTVELFVGGASVGSLPYTGTPVTFCVPAADGSDIPVRAEGTDARGTGSAEIRVTIDSRPPDDPVDDLDVTIANRRAGELDLAWTAVADAGGGPITSYRIRCATSTTSPVTFDWDTATSYSFTGVAGTPGTRQTQRLLGFRIERYVACMVRPVDAPGSLGPVGNTDEVHLAFLQQEIQGPPGAQMGSVIRPCGSVNGDPYPDFIIGSWAGNAAHLIFGSGSGVPTTIGTTITGEAGSRLGRAVAGIGDFNGDTINDVAVGAPTLNATKGAVYVYYGRPSWPPSLTTADADVTLGMDDPGSTFDDGARLGWDIAPAGDYDGDGLADLIVGAPGWNRFVGAALLLFGRSIPSGTTIVVPGDYATAFAGDLWLVGSVEHGQFGTAVAAAYRVNLDQYDDVVIGAPGRDRGGSVVLSFGRSRPASTSLHRLTSFEIRLDSPRAARGVHFGLQVAATDIGSDGRYDLLVGLEQHPGTSGSHGGVLAFLNDGTGGFPGTASFDFVNDVAGNADDWFGVQIAPGAFLGSNAIARLDPDHSPELLFGGLQYGTEGGAGVLFAGRSFSGSVSVSTADYVVRSPAGDTSSRAGVAFVGDVNGDGHQDFVVGHSRAAADRGRLVIVY